MTLEKVDLSWHFDRRMLPSTLQFVIAMIACAINERMQRKLDYSQDEVRVLKELLRTATDAQRIS